MIELCRFNCSDKHTSDNIFVFFLYTMGRSPCCSDNGIKKGPWCKEEDERLVDYVQKNGPGNWQKLPKRAGLNRCGKSCRLRWTNYLRPDIKRGPFSEEEEAIIISHHQELGNKWSRIAAYLHGRTDNEIKNHWNTHLRRKLLRSGIDPKTHQQISDLNLLSQLLSNSNLSNLITPLNPALSFHGNATEMVTNFQFLQRLQNVLQIINSSPLPYLQAISQLNGLINGANTQYIGGNFFHPQNVLADLSNITPLLNEHLPSTSNSLQCCEGELSPQGVLVNKTIGFTNINNSEYSLPSLISVTPESSIINPLESTKNDYIPREAFESDIFDTLNNLLDDEVSSSFLKDIMG